MRALALVGVMVLGAPVRADELATSPLRPGYEVHAHLFAFDVRTALEDDGFEIVPVYALEMFASQQLDDELMVGGLFSVDINFDLATLIGPRWGRIHINPVGIHGTGPVNELMDVHGSSGNTAPEDIRIFEARLDQPIGPFTLRVGLLSADQEFVVADAGSTLIAATFGMTAQFSYNVGNPSYPIGTPGASLRLELDDVVIRGALYDGSQQQWHGIPTGLGPEQLVFGEAQFGPFKAGGWHHSNLGSGVYAIADAKVDRHVAAFARVGYSPDGGISTGIDAGIRIGPGPFRPDDVISTGIAFAQTDMGAQTLIEATYEAQIGFVTLQPAVQLIMLPERTVGLGLTRATIVL